MMRHHDRTFDAIGRLDPIDGARLSASWEESDAKQALAQEITAMPPTTRPVTDPTPTVRIPRRRLVVVTAVAVLMFSAVGVGANGLFSRTSYDDTRQIPARDIPAAIDRIGADVPLPPGGNFERLKVVAKQGGAQSERGLAGTLAFNAACQWYAHWYDTHTGGQPAAAASAVETMRQMPTWTPVADVDEGADEVVPLLQGVTTAAQQGRDDTVRRFLNTNCGPDSGWHG